MKMKTLVASLIGCFAVLGCSHLGMNSPGGGSASGGSSAASSSDKTLFDSVAKANLAEIATGKLAMQKAQSPSVKQFGQHMVDEHSALLQEGGALAQAKGIPVPSSPDLKHQVAMKKLELMSGESFDRAYMDQMVKDHIETLDLLKETVAQAADPQLKAQAEKAIPHVQQHLALAKQLAASTVGSAR
jgi:predicted outer membrane protein